MTREEVQPAYEKIVNTGITQYDQLTPNQKVWFNIEPLTTDGIIDHYINNAGEHHNDTLEALEFLRFYDLAEQMRRIGKLFNNGQPPSDIKERNMEWDSWSEDNEELIDEVDEIFWPRCSDLEKALMEHINRTGIGID